MGAFVVGSRVTWRSQAAGTWLEKSGEVVAVVAPARRGWAALEAAGISARPGGWGHSRVEQSYIVRATNGRLYWPRTSALKDEQLDRQHLVVYRRPAELLLEWQSILPCSLSWPS